MPKKKPHHPRIIGSDTLDPWPDEPARVHQFMLLWACLLPEEGCKKPLNREYEHICRAMNYSTAWASRRIKPWRWVERVRSHGGNAATYAAELLVKLHKDDHDRKLYDAIGVLDDFLCVAIPWHFTREEMQASVFAYHTAETLAKLPKVRPARSSQRKTMQGTPVEPVSAPSEPAGVGPAPSPESPPQALPQMVRDIQEQEVIGNMIPS